MFKNLSLRVGLLMANGAELTKEVLANEEGTLKDMAWVVGSAVVVAVVIVAALVFVPDTVTAVWNDLIAQLRTQLGM